MATPGTTAAPWLATTTVVANRDLDDWLPGDGRTVPNIPVYLANNAVFNVKDFGATGDGTTDDRAILHTVATTVPATGGVMYLPPGTYRVGSALAIPSNVTMQFSDGASLSVDAGITVTINGGFLAPPVQVFALASGATIIFGTALNQWPFARATDVYPEWWGINGAVAPYDTAAVQAAINTQRLVKFNRHYYVTTVSVAISEQQIDGAGYKLIGVSTTANTDAILQIQCTFSRLSRLHVDGNFNTNYKCSVRWFADVSHPSSYGNYFDGLYIENSIQGLVIGGHPDDPTPYNAPVSESTFTGLVFRGTQRPVSINQPNGKITFVSPQLIVSKNEWSGTFSYADSWILRNQPSSGSSGGAEVCILGGSLENNEAPDAAVGTGLRGANITVNGSVIEVVCPHRIEGDRVTIADNLNIATSAPAGQAGFVIASGTTGTLKLSRVFCYRDQSQFDNALLVDATAASAFLVDIADSTITDWKWSYASEHVPAIKGCRARLRNVRYVLSSPATDMVLTKDEIDNRFTTADPLGDTMSAVADKTTKNGWVYGGGAGANSFRGRTDDAPTGLPGCIEMTSVAGESCVIQPGTGANGFRVVPSEGRVFSAWVKPQTTTASGLILIRVYWYKYDGTASSTTYTEVLNWNPQALSISGWQRITARCAVPNDAAWGSILLSTSEGGVTRFTGFSI